MALHQPPFLRRRCFLSLGAGIFTLGLLAACGNSRPRPDDGAEQRFAQRGYRPERRYDSESLRQTWFFEEDGVDVALLLPREAGPFPLLLYLPGLGESADAGLAWRRQWAEAGYAVLALQPENLGPPLLRGERARNGDFQALGREAFSLPSLQRRARLVGRVLAELQRRQAEGQVPWRRIDASRPALAGYDLGAQTALALAGERGRDGQPLVPPLARVSAVLALSPYVDALGGGLAGRYGAVTAPVLLLTGSDDTDSYGLVTNAPARQAPFRYLPEGGAALLLVYGGSHALFAGSPNQEGGAGDGRDATGPGPGGSSRSGSRGDNRGSSGGFGGGMGRGGGAPGGGAMGGMNLQRQRLLVQHVSTAWLDEQLRQDPIAREWLERNAPLWMEAEARLQRR